VKVVIGSTSDTHAEIKQGLSANQEVLILQAGQGRELLEQAGISITPATQPAEVAAPPMRPQTPGDANASNPNANGANPPKRNSTRRPKSNDPAASATTAPAKP
jgi:hypothetical protein